MTDRPTAPTAQAGRARWLKEADIPMARLRERFALNEADEIIWLIGPRAGRRAGCVSPGGYRVIHSVLDGRQYQLRESRVVWALKHGRWPPDGHEVDLGNRNRGDDRLPPEGRRFPGVRKTKNGKFNTSVVAKGQRFDFGLFDDPETAYRVYLSAKETLDPHGPLRPAKGVKPNASDQLRVAIGIIRAARWRRNARPRRMGSLCR